MDGATAGTEDRSEHEQFRAKDKIHGNAIPDAKKRSAHGRSA
jgi:hypothetical protein